MGRIGSSPVAPFDSNGCPSVCDGVEESCKPPNIRTQITAGQRQRRAIGAIPFSSDVGNWDRNLLSGIFIELWSKQSYSTQHWSRCPTADIWGWFADCEAHADAAPRIAKGRSFLTPARSDHFDRISRRARSEIGGKCRYPAMSGHRVPPR